MSSGRGSSGGASLPKKGSEEGNDTSTEDIRHPPTGPMSISSDEINFLVYRYLQESGFVHSAFTFAYESLLNRSNVRNIEKTVPPGALISFLQKGLQYVGVEESLQRDGADGGRKTKSGKGREREAPTNGEHADFTLLAPQTMSALNRQDPPIRLNVPPATAAAAFKARKDAEAKLDAKSKTVGNRRTSGDSRDVASLPTQQSHEESSNTKSVVPDQATTSHAVAVSVMSQLQSGSVPVGAALEAAQRRGTEGVVGIPKQSFSGKVSRQGEEADAQAVAVAALQMVGQAAALNSQSIIPSNGADGPSSAPSAATTALHLQAGGANSAFSRLEETAARIETKESKSRLEDKRSAQVKRGGVAPMDIDDSRRHSSEHQHATHPYVNGVSSRGMDQNGHPVASRSREGAITPPVASSQPPNAARETGLSVHGVGDEDQIDREDELTKAAPSEILDLSKHSSEVFMCAWNPVYTNLIATGSGDASARIWQMGGTDASSGCVAVRELPHGSDPNDRKNKDVTTLEWSADGLLLATGSYDGVARVWSKAGILVHTLSKHRGPIFSLKWNRSGNYLLSGSYDQSTIVWSVSGGAGRVVQQFTDHKAPALDVDWKDDDTFASCSTDQRVLICRVGMDGPLRIYEGHDDEVNAVKWDPSGTLLASCSDDYTAKVWKVASDQEEPLHDLKSHKAEIYTVKWSPTGPGSANPQKQKMLATASFDGSVRLWNVSDGTCIRVFSRHRDSVYSVAFSPSGDYLASGSLAGQLYIWNVLEGLHVKSFRGKGDIFEVAWNVEETRVAACFSSSVVSVIDFKP